MPIRLRILLPAALATCLTWQAAPAQQPEPPQRPRPVVTPPPPASSEIPKRPEAGDRTEPSTERDRLARNRSGAADRDIPMPKPVPSIIAP